MLNFCHIAPTPHLYLTSKRNNHLVLAHLIEKDQDYVDFYLNEKANYDSTIIMDNSAFEMYKAGKEMYPAEKLIDMGKAINADYIVMPDYPGEDPTNTYEAALKYGPEFKKEGFETFFVPQGRPGSLEDLISSFDFAIHSEHVDYIGVSILAAPLAFNCEKENKLQRFLSRLRLMYILREREILQKGRYMNKKFHFLGMVDGPNELIYLSPFKEFIDTWDSSAAVWLGLNNLEFDGSPSGRMNGKFEKEVDFSKEYNDNELIKKAITNMNYIDDLVEKYYVSETKV